MTNQEAIETIKANYPSENYTILREALDMAIALLREQEAVKPIESWELNNLSMAIDIYLCGNCKEKIVGKGKYCSNCGTPVLKKRSVE